MGYKTFVSMNVAVVGIGKVSEQYAIELAMAGHQVFRAWKEVDALTITVTEEEFDNIYSCDIEEAAAAADLIIIATEPKDAREVAYWLNDVRRKVIIDATADVHTDSDDLTNTMNAIRSITGSQHVVKVVNTTRYANLLQSLFSGNKPGMLVAGDSKKAKAVTKILADDMDIPNCSDFGGDETILLLDEMAKCWSKLTPTPLPKRVKVNA